MKPLRHRLRYIAITLALLLLGLWLAGSALWQLGRTAVYVHKSVVVTGIVHDVRQKPFESWSETLGQGNWSMPGDVSYQPIVRFTLPGGINAIRLDLEADNEDYRIGQEISIISPPTQPGKARINRWKFIWGASTLRLGVGALLSLIGYVMLRRLRGKRPAVTASPTKKTESTAAPTKPKTPRKRKSTSGGSTPRRRKKTEGAADSASSAPKPRRRSSKKKTQEQSPELPF